VCLFSLSFTMNIALNNYSFVFIPLSVNLIIRSCLPLSTFISQQVAAQITGDRIKDCRACEMLCMLLGCLFAVVCVLAENNGTKEAAGDEHSHLLFGCIICIVSLFSGSVNLALAGVMGSSLSLNALDTTVYMSVPAAVILLPFTLYYSHPVGAQWAAYLGSETSTDWEIFWAVWKLSPLTIFLALLSGVLALGYNVLQYGIVQSLSATHTAFAGNFNKVATIMLALLVGLETLPEGYWGVLMLCAVFGNIGAFTAYNYLKAKAKMMDFEEEDLSPLEDSGCEEGMSSSSDDGGEKSS